MFDSIRSHRRWLMLFLLLLVFPSFVVTGIYGYNQFVGGDNAIAKVGGQPITQVELDAAHREQLDRLRGMFGENFDARMFDTPQARAATLDNLLAERALQIEAAKEHVHVTEARLREIISAEQAFQVDGKFSYDRYRQLLGAQGLTELGFEQRVRNDLARQALLQSVAMSSVVPKAVAEQVRRLADEQRQIRELRFNPQDYRAKVSVDDASIKQFYDANQSDFRTQESVRAEYMVLTLDDVAAQIGTPSEGELREYYERNKSQFSAVQMLDKAGARKKAEHLLAQVRSRPSSFEALAKEHSRDPGSADKGGDLGWFGRGMMVKPFEDAAFSLKEGETSGIVESDFGFHIIRVTGARDNERRASHILVTAGEQPGDVAAAQPFEQVRDRVAAEVRRLAALKKFPEIAEQFGNGVYEQPDSLKPTADKLKLAVQTVDSLTRAGVPPRPNTPQIFTPRLVEAIFGAESLNNKRNTEAIEVAPNTLVAARVVEHRPAALRPLAEVRDQIKARVEQREAARLAREAGEAKLAELRKTPSDAGFGAARTISRTRPEGLPAQATNAVMRAPADKLPAFVGAELDGGSYGVFQVLSSTVPDKSDPAQSEAQARALAQAYGAADDLAYVAAVRAKHQAQVLKTDLKGAPKSDEPAK